jgi:hypothetical protein
LFKTNVVNPGAGHFVFATFFVGLLGLLCYFLFFVYLVDQPATPAVSWATCLSQGVFSSSPKFFITLHRMFGHMHGVLNVDEKITNYTDYDKFVRQIF